MTIAQNPSKAKRAVFNGTVRNRLAWSIGGVALIMAVGLAGLLFGLQHKFLYGAAIRQATSLSTTLAGSSLSRVLANDSAGLNEVLQGFVGLPDLERAYILSVRGQVLGSTQPEQAGQLVADGQNQKLLGSPPKALVLLANTQQIDVAAPLMSGQRHVGWARVQMSMDGANANLRSIIAMCLSFIAFAALAVFFAAILLARRVTRSLHHLIHVAAEIESGNLNARACISGKDEVGLLAHSYNQILDALSHSERQKERTCRLYKAWTQSADIIVRESDEIKLLTEICRIIADQVAFELVWVGMAEPDGHVRPIAASHTDSAYLMNISVSADGTLPEGQGPVGMSIREGVPKVLNDFIHESENMPWQPMAIAENMNAAAAFPLMRGGRCIGAIVAYSAEKDYFSPDLIGLMSGLTDDISFALEHNDREKDRLNAEHELRIAAAAFESQEGILVTDADNIILRVNKSFTDMTGYSANEVVGKPAGILKSGFQDSEFYAAMWKCIHRDKYWQGEIWNKKKNGAIYPEWLRITAIAGPDGIITNYVGTFTDISQRKADEDHISYLAYYDSLTKLPNRTLLYDRLGLALTTSQSNRTHGALMILDLDNFKTLNDTLGHDRGDQLLIEVGQRLQNCVRETDTVARLGGDEFVILLECLDEQEIEATIQTHSIAEKIRKNLAEFYLLKANRENKLQPFIEHYSTVSIGLVLFFGHETRSEELLKRADLAMYQAKQAGRNIIRAFIPEMQEILNFRASLEADLRNALDRNELSLNYQVQVDVSGQPIGAEALIRWNQAERGMVSPAEFIPLAEDTGLILPIGAWILRQGCETLVDWAKYPETRELKLAVNISSRQINQEDFVDQVSAILVETGANPTLLKLEITESVILDNVDDTIAKMHAIRELGVNFSMDDFGTGYSSLSYLQKLPLEQLKIDQSFVRNMAFNNHDSAIIRTILSLGQNLALNVIAEGVETQVQHEYLANFGCLVFQGYLFGKPVPADIFKQSLLAPKTGASA